MTSHTSSTPGQTPLVALVHKQLAALESLATDGHTEAAALRADIAALAGQLNGAVARLARLEATLQSHAQLLAAIGAGLMQLPAAAPAPGAAERAAPVPTAAPAPPAAERATTPVSPAAAAIAAAPVPSAVTPTPAPPVAVAPAPRAAAERATAPVPPAAASQPAPVAAPSPPQPQPPSPVATPPDAAAERAAAPAALQPAPAPTPPAAAAPAPPQPQAQPVAQSQPAPASAAPTGPQVQRGSRVRVVFDDDTTETYTIVRQEETNRQRNLIGENSPLGAALLGAIVGELRAFRVRPAGPEQMVEVLEIS